MNLSFSRTVRFVCVCVERQHVCTRADPLEAAHARRGSKSRTAL